jgi:two-component system, NarL family, sensor histidine kinase DesK
VTAALRVSPRPFQIMVAATIAIGMISPLLITFGSPEVPAHPSALWLVLGTALVALQLRHSVAASRGEWPRAGGWTLLAMAVIVYAPLPWLTWNWLATQPLVMASAPMVLRSPRLARAAAAVPAVGTALFFPLVWGPFLRPASVSPDAALLEMVFWGIVLPMSAVVLYGAARMVRGARELQAAHTELAELAIAQERLRVSRDLHDLIGQSLSAVSLRGDLALRLVTTDPSAAETEIANLTATARAALHDMLAVTSDSGGTDLQTEADGARALLAAAGIEAAVELDPAALTLPARTVFAWALREGVTNVLRHSAATNCSITVGSGPDGAAALEIVNDGVGRAGAGAGAVAGDGDGDGGDGDGDGNGAGLGGGVGSATGSGLIGLAERARAFGGELTAGPRTGDWYCLRVEIPGESS